jgi:hypothetical protein
VEQLHNLPPLAAQKLPELLAEMLRLCPRGQENNAFFNCLFLNKLPRELRILLSEADMADKQALGARADLFAAHNSKQAHDVVATVPPFLPQSKRERRPRWLQSAQELAAGNAAAANSGVPAGGVRRSRDAVAAAAAAGVPTADPRGPGQDREWAVLQPLLLRG